MARSRKTSRETTRASLTAWTSAESSERVSLHTPCPTEHPSVISASQSVNPSDASLAALELRTATSPSRCLSTHTFSMNLVAASEPNTHEIEASRRVLGPAALTDLVHPTPSTRLTWSQRHGPLQSRTERAPFQALTTSVQERTLSTTPTSRNSQRRWLASSATGCHAIASDCGQTGTSCARSPHGRQEVKCSSCGALPFHRVRSTCDGDYEVTCSSCKLGKRLHNAKREVGLQESLRATIICATDLNPKPVSMRHFVDVVCETEAVRLVTRFFCLLREWLPPDHLSA